MLVSLFVLCLLLSLLLTVTCYTCYVTTINFVSMHTTDFIATSTEDTKHKGTISKLAIIVITIIAYMMGVSLKKHCNVLCNMVPDFFYKFIQG